MRAFKLAPISQGLGPLFYIWFNYSLLSYAQFSICLFFLPYYTDFISPSTTTIVPRMVRVFTFYGIQDGSQDKIFGEP